MTDFISGGFDLRLRPELVPEDPRQVDQHLLPEKRSPISADPSIWPTPEGVSDFYLSLEIAYPLGLLNKLDDLLKALHDRGLATANLIRVCLTISEETVAAFCKQSWSQHFANAPTQHDLLEHGWRFLGFDAVELNGLTSGLKGCGYVEPSWSQLRARFGRALNNLGLFADPGVASEFAEIRGNQIPSHAPFEVVGILVYDPLGE